MTSSIQLRLSPFDWVAAALPEDNQRNTQGILGGVRLISVCRRRKKHSLTQFFFVLHSLIITSLYCISWEVVWKTWFRLQICFTWIWGVKSFQRIFCQDWTKSINFGLQSNGRLNPTFYLATYVTPKMNAFWKRSKGGEGDYF